ncbi:MAG: hypothetical protein LBQ12_11740 [Deltaproteobacteria bacterium]|nr:hypothetical protein [Deltaproteobacteria bacterium]
MGGLLTPVLSAAAFAAFFLAFSLSLDFWGRRLLKALKAGDAAEPDGMLGCLAGAAGVFVVCRWLSFFTHSFEKPFAAFVGLGLLGAVWEILAAARKAKGAGGAVSGGGPGRGGDLRAVLAAREWAAAAALLAFALGLWFCRLWPSGGLEPWLTPSADFYSWIFQAGYWMGYTEAETYGIAYQHPWIFDGFGTDILFAMFSSARGAPAWLAAPGYALLLLSWIGAAVYGLVRQLAGFPRALSWLAALGVSCGWFFWFLAFYGGFGQLAASFGYLLALRAALGGSESAPTRRASFLRLFFPLLYLFLCYQAGYLMFAAACAAAAFLRLSFKESSGGLAGQNVKKAFANAWNAARPVLAATAAAALVSPQSAGQVVLRTGAVAVQTAGYGVHLLDPGLFSGIPLIADGGPFGIKPGVSFYEWAAFAISLAALWAIALRRNAPAFPGRDLAGMKALTLLFALFLGVYLAAFARFGDEYRIWKFASLTALPVSFVPVALLTSALLAAFRGRARRALYALALAAAVVAVPHMAYKNPLGKRAAVEDMRSLLPLAEVVEEVLAYDRDKEMVLFDFASMERGFAAMAISQYSGIDRVGFVSGNYFGGSVSDYLKFAERGAPVYSDRAYPGLFKGAAALTPPEFTVFRYDMDVLRRDGAAAFSGLEDFSRKPNRRILRLKLLPPSALLGEDLLVRISFAEGFGGTDGSCGKLTAREANSPPGDALVRDGSEFLIRAPSAWQRSGYVELLIEFPSLPTVPLPEGSAWDPRVPQVCRYSIDSVEIFRDAARTGGGLAPEGESAGSGYEAGAAEVAGEGEGGESGSPAEEGGS